MEENEEEFLEPQEPEQDELDFWFGKDDFSWW